MGPENSKQGQTRDRCWILGYIILEPAKFWRSQKRSKLGNFTFTVNLRSESGDPNNLGMNRKKHAPRGRNVFINEATLPNPGTLVFTDFLLLVGQPHDGWGRAGIIIKFPPFPLFPHIVPIAVWGVCWDQC